jgi:hypothetical protein
MTRRLVYVLPMVAGALLLAAAALSLTHTPAQAQCGSQASSCKNCHEVQAALPVNHDGNGWHESHAFGDFCANCHGGNVQATDETAAHTGLVAPLGDIQTNCAACHPADTLAVAQVYAAALGVEVGAGEPPAGEPTSAAATPAAAATTAAPAPTSVPAVASTGGETGPGVIDYNQQYAQTVQGQVPLNWGNLILGGLLVTLTGGGGTFAYFNERKLRRLAAAHPKPPAAAPRPEPASLAAQLEQLDPLSLRALQTILRNPDQANALLLTLARLDPGLIEQVRRLDRRELTLLVALAEEK